MFLISILLAITVAVLFKPDTTRFYCGIAAFNGPRSMTKEVWHKVLANMRLLSVMMDARGGDNCGILIDDKIHKCALSEREFKVFFQRMTLMPPTKSSTIIAHARKSSSGGYGVDNAHPFAIGEFEDGSFEMAGVHNGTIDEWEDLCRDFDVDARDFKVDSKALLTIINNQQKENKYEVFNKYKGKGAFVWYRQDEPNTLYLFKGSTPDYQNGPYTDERPLFVYYDDYSGGLYFCSTKEALLIIADDKDEVFNVKSNVVYKFENGGINKDFEVFKADRVYSPKKVKTSHTTKTYSQHTTQTTTQRTKQTSTASTTAGNSGQFREGLIDKIDISSKQDGFIYRNLDKYWRNGHVLNGFYKIDSKLRKMILLAEDEVENATSKVDIYAFVNGVMVKPNKAAVQKFKNQCITLATPKEKSYYTVYPVSNDNVYQKLYFFEGFLANGVYSPMFADNRHFHYKNGILQMITFEDTSSKYEKLIKQASMVQEAKKKLIESVDVPKEFMSFENMAKVQYKNLKKIVEEAEDLDAKLLQNENFLLSHLKQWVIPALDNNLNEVVDE